MKNIFIFIPFILFLTYRAAGELPEEEKRIEAGQIALWERNLEKAKQMPPIERIAKLWLGLRNMGYRKAYDNHSASVDGIYDKIQSELLSIPGHAQYFADEIERLIADPANKGTSIGERRWYIEETLPHLPSPETIRVLGNYLNDTRYTPVPGIDHSGGTRENSYLATNALRWIGLRESEDIIRTETGSRYSDEEEVGKLRAWWEEVKSGKRSFSFKGQKVEYRFKPDGTWDTIGMANPPDDGPKPPKPKPVPVKTPLPPPPPETTADSDPRRGMLVVAVLLILGVLWYAVKCRKQTGAK